MKTETENLLSDLLEDAASPAFRAALLERTLAQVRRRERNRRFGRAAFAVAVTFAAVMFLTEQPAKIRKPLRAIEGVRIIISVPSDRIANVKTAPGAARLVGSTPAGFAIIETDPSRPAFRNFSDDELLTVAPGQAAMLVRLGLSDTKLVIVDPATQLATVAGDPEAGNQSPRAR